MYTEEEAKTKWCPHVRAHIGDTRNREAVFNRVCNSKIGASIDEMDINGCRCIASDCMAWRWEMLFVPNADQPPSEWTKEPTNRGYCGAFGKPENV